MTLKRVRLADGSYQEHHAELKPRAGWLFTLDPGEDCESMTMGLCRYPEKIWQTGRVWRLRELEGWRLKLFCKTQYASLHGWEHFRRCHLAVLAALGVWLDLGVEVQISDEGEYWPRRSERALRENIGMMNAAIAGVAGASQDLPTTMAACPCSRRSLRTRSSNGWKRRAFRGTAKRSPRSRAPSAAAELRSRPQLSQNTIRPH